MLAALLVLQKSAHLPGHEQPHCLIGLGFPSTPTAASAYPWRCRGRSPACSYGSVLSLNACAVTNNNGPGITNNNNNGPPIATTAAPKLCHRHQHEQQPLFPWGNDQQQQ